MSSRKNVLFLPSWYPNRTAPSLGNFIQRHAVSVSRYHDVAVLYAVADPNLKDKYEFDITEQDGLVELTVYYRKVRTSLPFLSSFLKYKRFITAYRKGYAHLLSLTGKPDLLHVHVIWRAAIFALELNRSRQIPVLISEHWSGYMPEDGSYGTGLQKKITEELVDQAAAVIAVSSKMKEAMLSHGLDKDYHIIPNVVDTDLFHPAVEPSKEKTRILHVSTVNDREKNISGMIRVIKKLSGLRQDFVLEIIGDSPEREGFEKLASELGVLEKHVVFAGYRNIDEVAARMRSSSFFMMFSNYEGLPCVILEAMASGLPVVATNTGGIPQVVNEDRGILVNVGDEDGLLVALMRMLDEHKKYSRENLRKYAVENFSYAHVGGQISEIYEEVLS